jgi:hypothetical protein
MSKGPDPNLAPDPERPLEEWERELLEAGPIVQASAPLTERAMDWQREVMRQGFNMRSPVANMVNNTMREVPPSESFFSREGLHKQSGARVAWRTALAKINASALGKVLSKHIEQEEYIVDGGTKYVLVPIGETMRLIELLEVATQHGVPDAREPLSHREVSILLDQINGFLRSNNPPNKQVEAQMRQAHLQDVPRRHAEVVLTTLSYLGLLP